MQLYFFKSQIPELAGLTPLQRKLVYECGLEACLTEQPALIWSCTRWVFGGLAGGALVAWLTLTLTRLGWDHYLLVVIVGALAGMLTAIFVAGQILTAQLRPYLRRVLEARRDELARIK